MIKEEFAATLMRLLRRVKKSKKQLSRESGISFRFLQEIEAGKKQPTLTTLLNLAAALDVTPDELVMPVWTKWQEAGQPDE